MVEIFADGADLESIRRLAGHERVTGFTTNPSLMRKAGISNYRDFAREVLDAAAGKPVSFEVFADDQEGMERQAREIASWGNVFVKIPVTNSKGEFTSPLITRLSGEGLRLNITAVMTDEQVQKCTVSLMAAGSIISIFAGRIADAGIDPEPIVRAAAQQTKATVLWASARELFNVKQAERCGAGIITLSPELIEKLPLFGKDLTKYSLETVQQFKRDAEGFTI